VKEARRIGRKLPRRGTRGLPNVSVDLKFRLSREELEMVRKAMEMAAVEMASVPPVVVVVEGKKGEEPGVGEAPWDGTSEPAVKAGEVQAPGVKAPEVQAALKRESEDAAAGLRKLGYGKTETRELVRKALGRLGNLGRSPTAEEIVNTVLRGRAVVLGGPVSADAETAGRGGGAIPQMRKNGPGGCWSRPGEPLTARG